MIISRHFILWKRLKTCEKQRQLVKKGNPFCQKDFLSFLSQFFEYQFIKYQN
jgi:hypothetical protein